MRPVARIIVTVAAALLAVGSARAEEGDRLFEREPYDQITLDADNGGQTYKIKPLAERAKPKKPDPEESLRVRLLDVPENQYDIFWRHITKLEMFEELVLAEAERIVANNQFDDVYDYFVWLDKQPVKPANLEPARHNFLYRNGGYLYQQKRLAEALALMEELNRAAPNYKFAANSPAMSVVVGRMADKLVESYFTLLDYRSARQLVKRLETSYPKEQQALVEKWKAQLVQTAAKLRDATSAHVQAGRMREAYDTSRQMMDIWPETPGAAQLAALVAKQYPVVLVGVLQPGGPSAKSRASTWGQQRTSRLAHRPLVEFAGFGPEHSRYVSPWGEFQRSDDRQRFTLRLTPREENATSLELNGYAIARRLLEATYPGQPAYSPAVASRVQSLRVIDPHSVEFVFRRPELLPEGLLFSSTTSEEPTAAKSPTAPAAPQSPSARATEDRPYVAALPEAAAARSRWVVNSTYAFASAGQPREIEERHFPEAEQAVRALRRGEIDVLDQLFPADVPALLRDTSLSVRPYLLPTVHFLAPNYARAYPASRTFRRALEYALDRPALLKKVLLGDGELPGCRVLSGPFPAGLRENDPAGYAYDQRLQPRAFDPRLAATLLRVAEQELAAEATRKSQQPPERQPLRLVHPAGEVARFACQGIAAQLAAAGCEVNTRELAPGVCWPENDDWDFAYVSVVMREPLVEAAALLGAEGLVRSRDAYVNLSLRKLDQAQRWEEARALLLELHRVVYDDITVLPLWQIAEYAAVTKRVAGLSEKPQTLYENVEQWRVAEAAVAE